MNFTQAVRKWGSPGLQERRSKHVTFGVLLPPPTWTYRRGQSSLSHCGCTGKMSKTRSLVLKPRGITFDVHLQRNPQSFAVFSCSSLMNTKYGSRPCSDRTFPKMKCAVDVAETRCTAAGCDPMECPLRIGLNWCRDVFFMSIYLISFNYNSVRRKWNMFSCKKKKRN